MLPGGIEIPTVPVRIEADGQLLAHGRLVIEDLDRWPEFVSILQGGQLEDDGVADFICWEPDEDGEPGELIELR